VDNATYQVSPQVFESLLYAYKLCVVQLASNDPDEEVISFDEFKGTFPRRFINLFLLLFNPVVDYHPLEQVLAGSRKDVELAYVESFYLSKEMEEEYERESLKEIQDLRMTFAGTPRIYEIELFC
jgi:hypothetical protein